MRRFGRRLGLRLFRKLFSQFSKLFETHIAQPIVKNTDCSSAPVQACDTPAASALRLAEADSYFFRALLPAVLFSTGFCVSSSNLIAGFASGTATNWSALIFNSPPVNPAGSVSSPGGGRSRPDRHGVYGFGLLRCIGNESGTGPATVSI